MGNLLDRVGLAFLRLFEDISGGNVTDVLIADIGIVVAVAAIPLIVIGTVIGGPRN